MVGVSGLRFDASSFDNGAKFTNDKQQMPGGECSSKYKATETKPLQSHVRRALFYAETTSEALGLLAMPKISPCAYYQPYHYVQVLLPLVLSTLHEVNRRAENHQIGQLQCLNLLTLVQLCIRELQFFSLGEPEANVLLTGFYQCPNYPITMHDGVARAATRLDHGIKMMAYVFIAPEGVPTHYLPRAVEYISSFKGYFVWNKFLCAPNCCMRAHQVRHRLSRARQGYPIHYPRYPFFLSI